MTIIRTILRPVAVVVAALGVSLAGAGIATAAPVAATEVQAVTMTPARIQFEWVSGKQQWAQPSLDRLRRTVFQARADGRFVMAQPDGYPAVVGRISGDGSFEGEWANSVGSTGATNVHIFGRISVDGGEPRMSLTYASGSAIAANVNGQQFGTNATKVYRAQMVMQGA